jgi:hypothetical protein
MSRVNRREAILERQAAKAGLTECGTKWLIQSLDPFHDVPELPTGYPDTNSNASIVQCVKQSYQIAAPIASGNWDCNIAMMPWINPITMNALTGNGASLTPPKNSLTQANPSTAGDVIVGGIQVISAASGTALNIQNPTVAGTSQNASFTIPSQYLQGNSRVVSMAMEICNTTSKLNLQGLVTAYRIPVPQNDDATTMYVSNNASGDTTFFQGAADCVYIPSPPQTIAAAQLFAGTQAWEAEYGTYQVAGFNTPDVPANGINFTQPVIYNTAQTDADVLFAHTDRTTTNTTDFGLARVSNVAWTEFDMSGSFFTGLSNTTTLTVNYIVYIERFPTQDDLDLIVSAHRSPEYDIKALEAHSAVYQSLPVAVKFGANGWGDWFDAIADGVQAVLPAFGTAGKVGTALIGGARIIKNAFDRPASDNRVGVPDAPPMSAPRQRKKKGKNKADKAVRKEIAAVKKRLKRDEDRPIRRNAQGHPILNKRGQPIYA